MKELLLSPAAGGAILYWRVSSHNLHLNSCYLFLPSLFFSKAILQPTDSSHLGDC